MTDERVGTEEEKCEKAFFHRTLDHVHDQGYTPHTEETITDLDSITCRYIDWEF